LDPVSVRQRLRWLNARGPEMAELLGLHAAQGFTAVKRATSPCKRPEADQNTPDFTVARVLCLVYYLSCGRLLGHSSLPC
jgi:hypothetical protein